MLNRTSLKNKRIMSLSLVLILMLIIMPLNIVKATEASGLDNFTETNTYITGQFSDVADSAWYANSVATAYKLGLVRGSSAITFNPTGNITIAETIVLACRLHNIYNGGIGEFIQGSPWYQVYVDYALANGIISVTYNDYNTKISRANFAYILSNALPIKALEAINNIADGALYDVSHDYRANSIYMLYRAGILTGNDKYGTFNPNSTILRSEVAAIVTRMANKDLRKTFTLSKINKTGNISAEVDEISLKSGESYTFMVTTYKDDLTLVVNYNSDQVETIWGEWQGNRCPLTIKALSRGDSELKIYFEEEPTSCIYVDVYIDRVVDVHYHSYSTREVSPTCTEQGYTIYSCACGHSYNADYVKAKGHTEVVDPAVPATATSTGLTEGRHCSVCGIKTVAQQVVPKDTSSLTDNTTFSLTNSLSQEYAYAASKLYTKCKIENIEHRITPTQNGKVQINITLQMKKTKQGEATLNNLKFHYTLYRNGVAVKSGDVIVTNADFNTLYEKNITYTGEPGDYTMTCKSVIY